MLPIPVLNHVTAWLPAMVGMLVICGESTRTMGGDHTTVWLIRLCSPLMKLALSDVVELNHILRKSGHFLGYGALGVVYVRGWLAWLATRLRQTRIVPRVIAGSLGVLSVFVVASMDELHQSFLPNRSACFSDVLLDTAGAVLFVLLTLCLFHAPLQSVRLGPLVFSKRAAARNLTSVA